MINADILPEIEIDLRSCSVFIFTGRRRAAARDRPCYHPNLYQAVEPIHPHPPANGDAVLVRHDTRCLGRPVFNGDFLSFRRLDMKTSRIYIGFHLVR